MTYYADPLQASIALEAGFNAFMADLAAGKDLVNTLPQQRTELQLLAAAAAARAAQLNNVQAN